MGLSIRAQALSLLLACALGAGLALLYDLLRPLRRRGGDALWDLLFCLCAASAAFLFAMRSADGTLGSGELLLSLAGVLLYVHLLSPLLLPYIVTCGHKIGVFCVLAQNQAKKVSRTVKKLFQKRQE